MILYMYVTIILKEDETPTSIGGELQQFSLGGSPISFQDKPPADRRRGQWKNASHSITPRQERQRRS